MSDGAESWGDALARAANLPPEGGTIEMPDGTRIVVVPVEPEPPPGQGDGSDREAP